MEPILKESIISLNNIHKSSLLQIPPWIFKNPKVNLQLNQLHKKKNTSVHLLGKTSKYPPTASRIPMYLTDGSRNNNKTAHTAVLNKIIKTKALPKESSIFTAKAYAIDLALDTISKEKQKNYHIFRLALCPIIIK